MPIMTCFISTSKKQTPQKSPLTNVDFVMFKVVDKKVMERSIMQE